MGFLLHQLLTLVCRGSCTNATEVAAGWCGGQEGWQCSRLVFHWAEHQTTAVPCLPLPAWSACTADCLQLLSCLPIKCNTETASKQDENVLNLKHSHKKVSPADFILGMCSRPQSRPLILHGSPWKCVTLPLRKGRVWTAASLLGAVCTSLEKNQFRL